MKQQTAAPNRRKTAPADQTAPGSGARSVYLWIIFIFLTVLCILALPLLSPKSPWLPVALHSILHADYSADQLGPKQAPIAVAVIGEVIQDLDPTQVPERMATLYSAFETPVPSVTPGPNETLVPFPTITQAIQAASATPQPVNPTSTPFFTSVPSLEPSLTPTLAASPTMTPGGFATPTKPVKPTATPNPGVKPSATSQPTNPAKPTNTAPPPTAPPPTAPPPPTKPPPPPTEPPPPPTRPPYPPPTPYP